MGLTREGGCYWEPGNAGQLQRKDWVSGEQVGGIYDAARFSGLKWNSWSSWSRAEVESNLVSLSQNCGWKKSTWNLAEKGQRGQSSMHGCLELGYWLRWESLRTQDVKGLRCVAVLSHVLHGLWPARLPCPWNSPGRNTGVHCHFHLQGICPTQGSNSCFLSLQSPILTGRFFTTVPLGNPIWRVTLLQLPNKCFLCIWNFQELEGVLGNLMHF